MKKIIYKIILLHNFIIYMKFIILTRFTMKYFRKNKNLKNTEYNVLLLFIIQNIVFKNEIQ